MKETIIGMLVILALFYLVGFVFTILEKELKRDEIKRKKEEEIENTSADDLVAASVNSDSHERRKDRLKQEFRTDSDKLLDDFLRRANKASGRTNPESGRTEN